jgi:SHS2 domain-containing protein
MSAFYSEREHAADIFVEIRGRDLAELYDHGLHALYLNLVELEGVQPVQEMDLEARGAEPAETLRALMGEALYQFETTGFLAAAGQVLEASPTTVRARLKGEPLDPSRHAPLSEIKAVTYHRLWAGQQPDGSWSATVIFDV